MQTEPSVSSVSIADPATYWSRGGFAPMTPPIRLPSRDGREQILVWLRIPGDARIDVVPGATGHPTLAYPPGTVADRVDMNVGEDPRSIHDVRGTRFQAGGEWFHVLRRLDGGVALRGLEWPRDGDQAGRAATASMVEQLGRAGSAAESSLFAAQNDCAFCHVHGKSERRRMRAMPDEPPPNRSTDASGLYTVSSVLLDGAPVEMHRARDMNADDPYVTVTCSDGQAADLRTAGVRRGFVCADGSVPYATLDMRRALADGDAHARAVCDSRAYLWRHMASEGRAAFAAAFDECVSPRLPP